MLWSILTKPRAPREINSMCYFVVLFWTPGDGSGHGPLDLLLFVYHFISWILLNLPSQQLGGSIKSIKSIKYIFHSMERGFLGKLRQCRNNSHGSSIFRYCSQILFFTKYIKSLWLTNWILERNPIFFTKYYLHIPSYFYLSYWQWLIQRLYLNAFWKNIHHAILPFLVWICIWYENHRIRPCWLSKHH